MKESMYSVTTYLQVKLAKVYFRFKRIEEIIYIYDETREKTGERFHSVNGKVFSVANKFGIAKQ